MSKFKEKLGGFFKREGVTSGAMTAIVIAIFLTLNIVTYTLGMVFFAAQDNDDLTISGATDALFAPERIGELKVTITFCQSSDEMQNSTEDAPRWVLATAEQLAERYDFISLQFVNIITKKVVSRDNQSILDFDIDKYVETDEKGNPLPILRSSVIFESQRGHQVLTDRYSATGYADFFTLNASGNAIAYNGEEVMASMVSRVLDGEPKSALITTYHGEVVDIGLRTMLICAGYDVDMINLREKDIPEDTDLVIISNPQNDFERAAPGSTVKTEIERLRIYMQNGGNLYVALDPYVSKLTVLESFISEYGISLSGTERDGKSYRNIIKDTSNAITADAFTLVANIADGATGSAISTQLKPYNSPNVIVSNCAALNLSGNAEPLLVSSGSSSTYAGGYETSRDGGFCISAVAQAEGKAGEAGGKIMVVPCIYLTATDILVSGGYGNRDFLYSVFNNVYGAEHVPFGCESVFYSDEILENLTMGTARIYTVLIFLIPAAIAVAGAFVIIRRKNR